MLRCFGQPLVLLLVMLLMPLAAIAAAGGGHAGPDGDIDFPKKLASYDDPSGDLGAILKSRAREEPFNLAGTVIFFAAILHTFLTSRFMAIAHRWTRRHRERIAKGLADRHSVHIGAELFHFLGEIEVVFGLWAAVLTWAIFFFYDWDTLHAYITQRVNFTEPMFVVVIMTLAATRPILKLAEAALSRVSGLLGGSLRAWWLTLLTAFNDNAAITFLSTLVPDLTDRLKYAVVAGAVSGGGLTIIANAPNPAGQSILKKYFQNGISPLMLLAAAALPTVIMLACFIVLR